MSNIQSILQLLGSVFLWFFVWNVLDRLLFPNNFWLQSLVSLLMSIILIGCSRIPDNKKKL